MLFLPTFAILTLLGLTSAVKFNDDKDTLKFEVKFRADASYQLCDKDWQTVGDIVKGESRTWTWNNVDIGSTKANNTFFRLWAYQGDDAKSSDTTVNDEDEFFLCSLTPLKESRFIHNYEVQRGKDWLVSTHKQEEARLSCLNSDNSGRNIETDDLEVDEEKQKEEDEELDKYLATEGK